MSALCVFFFSSRRRHTRFDCDWSSDVCSSDLSTAQPTPFLLGPVFLWRVLKSPSKSACASIRNSLRSGLPSFTERSEEHTSELQSQSNLVCRLLLEKKNRPP